MTRYSHTKLDVARQCMMKFKFQYIDKIKIEDTDTSASDFGSLCHEIAENYKGGGKVELLALYHSMVPSKFVLTDEYKQKVPLALQNIHEYWATILSKNDVKEVKHESDITIELNGTINLNGKIDIIVEKIDGRYRIVDYKTNKSNHYANHTSQLAMYMLLLNKKYGIQYDKMDCEVVYLSMDALTKKGEVVKNKGYENFSKIYKLDECDVSCLVSEIETIDKTIQKSIAKNEWKSKPGKFNCTYCPFTKHCDKKWTPESELSQIKNDS